MKFVKYQDIKNVYIERFINKIIFEKKDDGLWIVTEKIHGANFSFWWNTGENIRIAKRTCFLDDNSNFFRIDRIKNLIINKINYLIELISLEEGEINEIGVFGELFGGSYPHPDVLRDNDAKKIGKGVWYYPRNDFIVFDIKVNGHFLPFKIMHSYCKSVDLNVIDILFEGTMKECLEYTNKFESTIYQRYNLPKIEDNICEGIVIRPNETKYLSNGERVILKSKNERFSEKSHEKKRLPQIPHEWTDVGKVATELILSLITEMRYDSIISKIGKVENKDFGKICGLFAEDVFKEFNDISEIHFDQIEKEEQKIIRKEMGRQIPNIIRNKLILGR